MATPEELAEEFGYTPSNGGSTKLKITVSPNNNNAENLAKEFGYDPNYQEPVKPEQAYWQGLKNDETLIGTVKRLGIGALRGAKDIVDTGAEGLAKGTASVAESVLPENLSAPIRQSADTMIAENKSAREQFNKEYPPSEGVLPTSTEVGRIGGQIAATLPIMPTKAFGAINSAVGALPTITATGQKIAAPLVKRMIGASGTGAVGGGILGGAASSSNDKSFGENVGEGVVGGAIGGPVIEGAGQLAKNLAGKFVGKISSARASLAERAEQLGINLKATQVSESPTLKKYDQISGMLPFSGAQGVSGSQINQFTRAVSKTFGKDVEEITPEVVRQARKDIGSGMEALYKRSTVKADSQLANDFNRIISEAHTNLSEVEQNAIFNNIKNVAAKVKGGVIDGEAFAALVKYDGILSKLQKNSNPNISKAASEIRSALESALTRSVGTTEKAELNALRRQYKSVMTIKELVENDPEGKVNPLKLMRKVIQSPGGKLGAGDLGELADIGRAFFINPNDSGTPLGTYILNNIAPAIHNPVSAAMAAGGALMKGAAFADLGLGATGLAINRGIREVVNSKTVKEGLIRAGKGNTHGTLNDVIQKIEPYSSVADRDNRSPLQITVTPANSKERTLKLPIALRK